MNPAPRARSTCHDCGVTEGEIHFRGCDMERCPFCGGRLITCDCVYGKFYPEYRPLRWNHEKGYWAEDNHPTDGLPREVYENGIPDDIGKKWDKMLEEKGRVPYIVMPNQCALCGELWPEMFIREDWKKVVPKDLQDKMLCLTCYKSVKKETNNERPLFCCKCGISKGNLQPFADREKDFANLIESQRRNNPVCDVCFTMIKNWQVIIMLTLSIQI